MVSIRLAVLQITVANESLIGGGTGGAVAPTPILDSILIRVKYDSFGVIFTKYMYS